MLEKYFRASLYTFIILTFCLFSLHTNKAYELIDMITVERIHKH